MIAALASAPARRHAPQSGDTLRASERGGWRRARVRDGRPKGRDAGPLTAARRAAQQPGPAQRGHARRNRPNTINRRHHINRGRRTSPARDAGTLGLIDLVTAQSLSPLGPAGLDSLPEQRWTPLGGEPPSSWERRWHSLHTTLLCDETQPTPCPLSGLAKLAAFSPSPWTSLYRLGSRGTRRWSAGESAVK